MSPSTPWDASEADLMLAVAQARCERDAARAEADRLRDAAQRVSDAYWEFDGPGNPTAIPAELIEALDAALALEAPDAPGPQPPQSCVCGSTAFYKRWLTPWERPFRFTWACSFCGREMEAPDAA